MSIIQGTSKSSVAAAYEIEQSIRFDNVNGINAGGAQMYRLALNGTPTNDKKATISAWVKRATLGYNQAIAYSGDPNGSTFESLRFNTDDTITFSGATSVYTLTTNQVFRDVNAWYHIVAEIDTSAATAADRASLYVNGEKVTSFSTATYPTLNRVINWTASSGSIAHTWGTNGIPSAGPSSQLFAGYLAEMYVLDGENAGPTAFGEFDDSGVWIPASYSGAFGNNGYYMTGETASALGDDFSGNGLDFTTVALATTDQMLDTPTDNFGTMSSINSYSGLTLADGNLKVSAGAQIFNKVNGTFWVDADQGGAWYFEYTVGSNNDQQPGWTGSERTDKYPGENTDSYSYSWARNGGAVYNPAGITSDHTGSGTYASGDILGWLIDFDNDEVKVGKVSGGSWSATITWTDLGTYKDGGPAGGAWTATDRPYNGNGTFNFGQTGGFAASNAPGQALKTSNLSTPSIKDGSAHFQTTLYTGDGSSSHEINQTGNSNFEPSMVWIKSRSAATLHVIQDQVRGNFVLYPNLANAEGATGGGWVKSFDSDGFTTDVNVQINDSGETFAAWQWKAAGSGSSNTDGSITSTVSANTTAGFSVSTYTGNGTVGATVGHGLGVAPKVVIVKSRSNAESWIFGHDSVGWTKAMYMQTTGAPYTLDIYWNNTAPTSSVVELHDHPVTNGSGYTYVMYAFAEIPGYSSFGSYTGNGSADGPFIYTNGMTPKWVMIKSTSSGTRWYMLEVDRAAVPGANVVNTQFFAELANAESAPDVGSSTDFLSNGFKVRTTGLSGSGQTFTYMAFAENPFGGDGVAPATAR